MTIKSVLTASVLCLISVAAFANNSTNTSTFCKPGFYTGIQGGRSDTFYHSDDVLREAANNGVGTSIATSSGPIFGHDNLGHFGIPAPSITTTTSTSLLTDQNTDDIGIGGRIYAGYQFNPYFALETGFTQYAKTSFHAIGTLTSQIVNSYAPGEQVTTPGPTHETIVSTTQYEGEVTEHAIDLVAKGTLPLPYGLGIYAKAGMAYIQANKEITSNALGSVATLSPICAFSSVSGCLNHSHTVSSTPTPSNSTHNFSILDTQTYEGFRPVAGVGINYAIPTTNISLDGSYTRVFSYGGIPNAALLALGLEYKFA